MRGLTFLVIILILTLLTPAITPANGQAAAGSVNHCPALPPPSGTLVNVSDVTQLVNTVDSSVSGATILIADGIYNMALVNNP